MKQADKSIKSVLSYSQLDGTNSGQQVILVRCFDKSQSAFLFPFFCSHLAPHTSHLTLDVNDYPTRTVVVVVAVAIAATTVVAHIDDAALHSNVPFSY